MSAMKLKSRKERVELLRAGLTGEKIEKMFVELNGLKIVGPVLYVPSKSQ